MMQSPSKSTPSAPTPTTSPSHRRATSSLSRQDSASSSRRSSRTVDFFDDDVVADRSGDASACVHLTRISSRDHLRHLTADFLSNDDDRPLLHVDGVGNEYTYYLNPMGRSVLFILLVEMLERFSFYGINYTTTAYLTGEYNDDWNADMPSVIASSYVSISTAVAYTTPFLGALLADNLLGEYMTILLGCLACYIPGLLLIAFTTIPQFLGREFNRAAINWGLLALWPMGTGMVKACVNVFGAKQFHPILQSSYIESYYVNFYMCINIGALTGGIVVPVVAQWNVTVAYFIPVCMLGLGVVLFGAGTGRYVRPRPTHDVGHLVRRWAESARGWAVGGGGGGGGGKTSRSKRDRYPVIQPSRSSCLAEGRVGIGTIALLSSLVVPFNVAYAQMATTFIVQGSVMRNFGIVDAPMMNNADAVSVLAFGYLIGNVLYPELNRRGIKIPTTYKFAIGSAFGAWAVGCAIMTDYRVHRVYRETGEAVTVLWQVFPYLLIGIGEIFAVSAAYELAFTVAPARMKSIASAANLFMVGGVPNVLCILLYNACGSWFLNADGEARIHKLHDYASARVVNCFWVVEAISLFGVFINVLPCVKNWVADIETSAAETVKSPMSTPNIRKNLMMRKRKAHRSQHSSGVMDDEESPLIKSQKHAQYLKYGDGPSLNKFGSMRAGPSISKALVGSGNAMVPQLPSHPRPPKSSKAMDKNSIMASGLELMP
ncbi:hypothetical protein ACHAW5_009823 [Stephanodiscus triporus]|uniref:Major facilitator superfamily (MFS) profile domain-containing protein n=1 Tax=Stephanodiscus triporus TaxID=2934178 RepID=A0ABD3PM06_9STRA